MSCNREGRQITSSCALNAWHILAHYAHFSRVQVTPTHTMHSCLFLHLFQHRHPVLQLHPHCSFLRRVQLLPLRKEGCSLAAWPNKALSQVMSPRPSSKSAANTDFSDLATTVDASEKIDPTEVGQLTSPLFSKDREVNANPFSDSGSQAHSSVEKPMRDTDLFSCTGKLVRDTDLFSSSGKPVRGVESSSSVARSLSKGQRNRELESVQLSS